MPQTPIGPFGSLLQKSRNFFGIESKIVVRLKWHKSQDLWLSRSRPNTRAPMGSEKKLLVFDELHKMPRWKSWLKGIYDQESGQGPSILIIGSAQPFGYYPEAGLSRF